MNFKRNRLIFGFYQIEKYSVHAYQNFEPEVMGARLRYSVRTFADRSTVKLRNMNNIFKHH